MSKMCLKDQFYTKKVRTCLEESDELGQWEYSCRGGIDWWLPAVLADDPFDRVFHPQFVRTKHTTWNVNK
jgi:hypothetical protein